MNKVTAESQNALAMMKDADSKAQAAKLEAEGATSLNAQLQKLLSAEKNLASNHQCREADLRLELTRVETEKNEYFSQIKRLEASLETQLQREADFKRRLRERDLKTEEDKTTFALQVQSRNKIVEEILSLQAQQQAEIASLQIKIEDAKITAEKNEKNWTTANLKGQVEKLESEKKWQLAEETLEMERQKYSREIAILNEELELEKEKVLRESRDAKLVQVEQKRLKKEMSELVIRADKLAAELEAKAMHNQLQNERIQNAEEKQRQKEKLWQQEIEYLKAQLAQANDERENSAAETRKRFEDEIEEKTQKVQSLQIQLHSDTVEHQARIRLVEGERDELRTRLRSLERKSAAKCLRCEELSVRLANVVASERKRTEAENVKSGNDRLAAENDQIAEALQKYKAKVKTLLAKNDELKNENQFFESKIEKLEKKMMDMIYGDTVEKRAAEEAERLRSEVQREMTRPPQQEQEANAVGERVQ